MKDVHAMAPTGTMLALGRVGISGVRKPLNIHRPDGVHVLAASFSIFVDLPETRKGSDLSRNAQVLAEIVDQTAIRPTPSLEAVCVAIAQELLRRHTYANEAQVRSEAEFFMPMGLSDDKISIENFLLVSEVTATRTPEGVSVRKVVGAESVGMTACPCAMETCRSKLEEEYALLKDPSMASMPIITHNQRNRTRLSLVVPEKQEIEAERILEVISKAQSSQTYAILKRGDEGAVVLNAHRNPKFVEDVVRDALNLAAATFTELPDTSEVIVETESEESIHKYNVKAFHTATLGDLRSNRLRQNSNHPSQG
jgi:GTP cyclohydrolase-4